MTAHMADEVSELRRTVAELEQKLRASLAERDEALAQQSATADILKAISRSAFDLESILTTLTESAKLLCGAASGIIFRRDGDVYRYAASTMDVPDAYREHEKRVAIQADRGTLIGRVALDRGVVHVPDAWTDPEYKEKNEGALRQCACDAGRAADAERRADRGFWSLATRTCSFYAAAS